MYTPIKSLLPVKIVNMSDVPKSFFIPLCRGGASIDKISSQDNLSDNQAYGNTYNGTLLNSE